MPMNLKRICYIKFWRARTQIFLGLLLFSLSHCQPLERGLPPEFAGFELTAVSESQIEVRWKAGQDDFLEATQLAYGVWFVEAGEVLDPESPPQILTEEGVLAYSLTGLKAGTSYRVLVRPQDRGGNFGQNETQKEVTTFASGQGLYQREQVLELQTEPDWLFGGRVFENGGDALGVAFASKISWYALHATSTFRPTETLTLPDAVLEAYLKRFDPNDTLDDLLVLTERALLFLPNRGSRFGEPEQPFARPRLGSVRFLEENEVVTALTFSNFENDAFIYSYERVDGFQAENIFRLSGGADFLLAFLDEDDRADLILLREDGLFFELGVDDAFRFGARTLIDEPELGGAGQPILLAEDGNGDGFVDIFIWDPDPNDTKLLIYLGEGNERFRDVREVRYDGVFYANPVFWDTAGDGGADLVFQTRANNAAILTGVAYRNVARYLGGRGRFHSVWFGDFVTGSRGAALLSREEKTLTVLLRNP